MVADVSTADEYDDRHDHEDDHENPEQVHQSSVVAAVWVAATAWLSR
jgi:hypothetical protein